MSDGCSFTHMGKQIIDEFTHLPGRERRYQLRRRKEGKCRTCGKDANGKIYCDKHARLQSEKRRKNGRYEIYKIVQMALSNGTLKRGYCHCGKLGEAHHKDYSKPLEVEWLCRTHHNEIHGHSTYRERLVKVVDQIQYQNENQRRYRRERRENLQLLRKIEQKFGDKTPNMLQKILL